MPTFSKLGVYLPYMTWNNPVGFTSEPYSCVGGRRLGFILRQGQIYNIQIYTVGNMYVAQVYISRTTIYVAQMLVKDSPLGRHIGNQHVSLHLIQEYTSSLGMIGAVF